MRNAKCFKLVRKWRVSLKRTHATENGGAPGQRSRNAAFQTHGACSHEGASATTRYACIRGDKSAGLTGIPLYRARNIGHELLENARVFTELSHDVVRLVDEVESTASKLVSAPRSECLQDPHFHTLASQTLKAAQRGSASCKHIDAVITDSVDRIRQGIMVMEHAGLQMLHVIDAVIQGAEMTVHMGKAHQAASLASMPELDDAENNLMLQQDAALAVQALKSWTLVLKRNLQVLRLSEQDEETPMFDARPHAYNVAT